jgi:hypothetical protein
MTVVLMEAMSTGINQRRHLAASPNIYKKNIMRRDGPMKDSFVIGIEENLEN